jgi:hypothetical protein
MKTFAIIFANLIIFANSLMASAGYIPELIVKSFEQHYPHAQNVCWEQVGNDYVADFYLHDREAKVVFTNEGKISEVDVLVAWKDLPKDVKMTVYKTFHNFAVEECDVIEHQGHEDGYFVSMVSGGKHYHLYFNHQHKLYKTTCTLL